MRTANIHEAKTQLSRLVEAALAGEEVVIARNGKPAVRLVVAKASPKQPRRLGVWEHLNINVPDSVFFDPDSELEALMDAPIDPTT